MEYAAPKQRISAFWFDTLLMISFFFILGRIFWQFMPGNEIRASAMQLYTEKEFNALFYTTIMGFIFVIWYNVFLPLTKLEGTLGQKVFQIRLAQVNGDRLDFKTSVRRAFFITLKYFLVISTGPILAFVGQSLATSILGLILPILALIMISVKAWRNPQGVGPVEALGKYRYLKRL